ncbi:hypothetical protein H4219_001321 [Mycoemilia scoparia]|uniref:Uncharacterized protein n=1 Tax=Mycoemilia scoparia TaxID=417184 RepID=A0A9W8A718_9FUNG|nr:hypothetical protein H4219_001321 [Mycoemilia scoparia]
MNIPEADLPKMSYQSKYGHICPLINGTVSQDVLEDQRFVHCVGRENVMFKSDDYIIPGSMMVTELSINNGTLVYSLAEDSFRFRMAPIPDSPYCNRKEREIKRLHSIEGPYLGDYNGDRVKQSSLVFLPAETTNSIDILNSQGWFDSGVFIFKLHLIKKDVKTRNSQNSAKNDESDKPVVVSEDWRRIQLLGYRVTMGDLRDLRNLNEYKLMHQKPIVLQTPLTTVVYFPATDIVLTVDTKWKKDLNGNYYQEHEPKAYEVPFTSALGESALSHIDVDDTGSVLVMRTTDDDLAILRRSLSPDQNVFDYRSFVTTPENFKDIKPIIRNSEAVKEGKPLKPPKNMLTNWKEWQMWFENVDIQQSSPWTDGMIVNEFGPMVNIIRVQDQANKGGLSSNKQHISSTRFVRIRNKDLTGATNKKINVGANNPIMNMLYSGEDRNSENGSDESTLFLISVNKDSKTKVWILNNESINNKHAVWQFFVNRWGYALQMIFIIFACIYNEQRWPS